MTQRLCEAGHRVTVIAPRRHYLFGASPKSHSDVPANLRLIDLPTPPVDRARVSSRLRYYLSQLVGGAILTFWAGSCDVVIASLTPSMLGAGAYAVGRLRGATFILDERDLSLDAAAQLKLLPSAALAVAGVVERHLHRHADVLVVATPGLRRMIQARSRPPASIRVVPNGFTFVPTPTRDERDAERCKLGWESKAVMLYAGGLGRAYDLDLVLDGFARVAKSDWRLAILGEGERKMEYRMRAARERLDVQFLEPVPKKGVNAICNAADVCLLALRAVPWSTCSLSTKLIDYMGAARPIITTGPGDNADIVMHARAGLVVPVGDPQAMAEAMEALLTDPAQRHEMGMAARQFVVDEWPQERFNDEFLSIVAGAAVDP